jgi:hypothetical protein
MKFVRVEWEMFADQVVAKQFYVTEDYVYPGHVLFDKKDHSISWSIVKLQWFNDAVDHLKRIHVRADRAINCYKEAIGQGRLVVKHHFDCKENPKEWSDDGAETIVSIPGMPRAKEIISIVMKERMGAYPSGYARNMPLYSSNDIREQRARQTLQDLIGDNAYHRYLRCGFVSYRGKSGKYYQVFPGRTHTRVFEPDRILGLGIINTHCLCAIFHEDTEPNPYLAILQNTMADLDGVERVEIAPDRPDTDKSPKRFCPTDQLLMRLVLLMADEDEFVKLCNRHPPADPYDRLDFKQRTPYAPSKPLKEIYAEIRQLVA